MFDSAWSLRIGVLCGLLLSNANCIVDPDQPCDENQVEHKGTIAGCVCAPGTVPTADNKGCEPCGEHEEAQGGGCVCASGYQRPRAGAACEEIVDSGRPDQADDAGDDLPMYTFTGEGMPCSSAADCEGYDATFCQTLAAPNVCLIQGCETGMRPCPESEVCCSFAGFALLESTNGLCTPADSCVSPGMVVTP